MKRERCAAILRDCGAQPARFFSASAPLIFDMPLPKAPSKLADILEDYGAPAEPEDVRLKHQAPKRRKKAADAAAMPAADTTDTTETTEAPAAAATRDAEAAPKAAAKARASKGTKTAAQTAAKTSTATAKGTQARAKTVKASTKTADKAPAEQAVKQTVKRTVKASAKRGRKAVKALESTMLASSAEIVTSASSPPAAPAFAAALAPKSGARDRRGRAPTPQNLKKLFVLDTNVLMHDPLSLFKFDEHDVFLPMTTLEELDNHKKGLTDVARNARSVSRTLDALIEANDGQIREGVPLALLGNAEARGRLWFETEPLEAELPAMLPTFKGDNSILATVKGVQEAFPERAAVLVSKDINMRIKATTLGIPAEDYFSDKALDDTDMLYTGRLLLEADFWEKTAPTLRSWQDAGATHYEFEAEDPSRFIVNECLAIDGDEGFMAIVTDVSGKKVTMRLLRDYRAKGRFKVWGIHARNREQNMALNLLMDPEIDFVAILGQAGTGKTLMTLAAALAQTIDERRFSEIIVTRATVSVGEDIGFLPGTEEEKMAPWMGALEDNLEVLHRTDSGGEWGRQASLDLIKSRIRIKSMSFMRGRTFLNKFVIIDEAQNLSPKQMKTLITRAGPGTKIVCMGNIAQIDTPYLTEGSSGLTYVVEKFRGWSHAGHITLQRGERSRLADYASEVL